jgi:hypothetical protein
MDVARLQSRLDHARTTLVLGDVAVTMKGTTLAAPIGFISFDLDFYSSTSTALPILRCRPTLRRVALYFDDLDEHYNHRWAGEILAIDEFNAESRNVKIDRWRGIRAGRPFHEAHWLDAMYMAHNLDLISEVRLTRPLARMR